MKLLRASLSVGESVFVRQFTFVAFALMAAVSVQAQNFPSKPIRIIVPQVPGGAAEVHAWRAAQKLTEAFGRPVIIENRPGANGAVGARLAARADPDGYTLFNCNINNALNDLLDPDPTTDLSFKNIRIVGLPK